MYLTEKERKAIERAAEKIEWERSGDFIAEAVEAFADPVPQEDVGKIVKSIQKRYLSSLDPSGSPNSSSNLSGPSDKPAHSSFGGSTAARTLRCPASVRLVEKVPEYLRKASSYAEHGSVLHEITSTLLDNEKLSPASFIGKTFGACTVTANDIENSIRPVVGYVNPRLNAPGAEFYLDQRVIFPDVPGGFGTLDLILRASTAIELIDFKYGAGVRVLAIYPEGEEDTLNAQLMFYAAAARHTLPEFFAGVETIRLTILQPVSAEGPDAEMVSSVEVSHDELDAFVIAFRAACGDALSPSPRLHSGPWCRFCPAKPICPEHTKPLLNFAKLHAQFAVPPPAPGPQSYDGYCAPALATKDYLQLLADEMRLVESVLETRTMLHAQIKRALDNGDIVPGYGLSRGRLDRDWRDKATAAAALQALGLSRDDVIAETVRSPHQIELRAKALGIKIPSDLIVSTRSGTSVKRIENVRDPAPGRDALVRSFSAALASITGGE
jgi:hypothetical protein